MLRSKGHQQLATRSIRNISGGPLVSIIMPAWNAEAHIRAAANTILQQSWTNLELLIVDDASSDGTWRVLQNLAAEDDRVRIHRNSRNLGPYVCKNFALREARGAYVTGQDADDWSHPQRIERHVTHFLKTGGEIKAGTTMMLRMSPEGRFANIIPTSAHHSPDGIRRRSFISCMFEREFMVGQLCSYDPVRFGADGEMLSRARCLLGEAYRDHDEIGMLCLDRAGGLTNHPVYGLRTRQAGSSLRETYVSAYRQWHEQAQPAGLRIDGFAASRAFPAPAEMVVPPAEIGVEAGRQIFPSKSDKDD